MNSYNIVNGTSYHKDTPKEVIAILESSRADKSRLAFVYGYPSGNEWEESEVMSGHVGRSTGDIKVPLLLKTKASTGGESILDHCIVKIMESVGKKVLYKKA
jgi:hypothetical protein